MKKRIHPNLLVTLIIIFAGVPAYFLGRGTPVEDQPKHVNKEIREVVDQLNRKVSVAVPVQRIISMNPVFEESLGFIESRDLLVAATEASAEELSIPVIRFPEQPDLEEIKALNPDLILVSSNFPEVVKKLEKGTDSKKVGILAFNPETLEGTLELTTLLGKVTGRGNDDLKEKLLKQIQ